MTDQCNLTDAQVSANIISDDQLMRIGRALEYLFPELPEIPLMVWHRFSFDVVQDAGGISMAHIRFAPIEQSASTNTYVHLHGDNDDQPNQRMRQKDQAKL